MDYSHSPLVIYLIGGLGVLLGVAFLALALVLLARPRGGGPPAPPAPPGA
jgi:hypothetical protein